MRLIELRNAELDADCIALSFKTKESLSVEPSYELELVSPDPELDLDALLGQPVGVDIDLDEGNRRNFHAHVVGAWDTGQMDDKFTYTLVLGSWLSFLDERRDCRIFQEMSVPEIVKAVFDAHQRTDYRFDLERSYDKREYCVQFRESDLAFVKRLLEDEGIYFWIEHEQDQHVVVMSDTQRFEDLGGVYGQMRFLPDGEEQRAIAGREGIQRLQRTRRVRPSNVALRDFDYHVPTNRLDSEAQIDVKGSALLDIEAYDYGAGYRDQERGERLARLRLEALTADANLLVGRSNARGLSLGRAFSLVGHPDARRNRRFHVVACELAFVQDGPDSTSQGRNASGSFRALVDDQPFRPERLTPKPEVPGIQSATVVGPPNSEVHTDKLGRIRVHFHWDRYKTTEEDASCWIRVVQAWAGKGWGVIAMPRVGQEVLVTYVDGNLDRPLVTGIVYNGDNPTPYDLPKDIRYSGMVSRSLKFGQIQHASQITFDDTRGAERVMVHAERDAQKTVERNDSEAVGQDKNVSVTGTSTSVTGISVSFTGVSVSFRGLAVGFTGLSTTFTGLSTSFTGISTSFTGVSTGFTGVSTSFTGVSTIFNGVSTIFTGVSTSMTGVATSLTGVRTAVTGTSISMTGTATSMTGTSTSMTGQSMSQTGVSLSITGTSTSQTGVATSVTGSATSITGVANSNTGVSVSITGSSTSTTGTSMSTTGTSTSTTGSSTSVTGTSTSMVGSSTAVTGSSTTMTGVSMATTGVSMSYTGASYAQTGMDLKQAGMQNKS